MRQRIYDLVGPARDGDYASRAYDILIVFVAVVSLIPMLFDSSKISQVEENIIWTIDVVTAYLLLFDYVLRWMTHDIKTGKGWKAFFVYPFTPMAIVDILAVLPTLNLVPQTLRFLRLLRIAKVFRYSKNLLVVTNACKREARTLCSVFIAVIVYMFVVALMIFNCEPESFANFFDAVCWACSALTGFGISDSRPTSYVGQTLSMVSSLVALIVVALPAGVITGSYINEVRESKKAGSSYFAMAGRVRIRLSELDNPKVWLQKNKKVLRYILVILACVFGNMVISLFLIEMGSPFWFIALGSALAAFLLEPAAGVIVAFIAAVITTLAQGDTMSMLFFISYAVVALSCGLLFPRESTAHKWLSLLTLLAVQIVVCGIINVDVYLLRFHADVDATIAYLLENNFPSVTFVTQNLELPPLATLFVGMQLARLVETVPLCVVFAVIVKLFGVHAAPTEGEKRQQEELLMERMLAQKELKDSEMRRIARESIERKYHDVVAEQAKLAEERKKLELCLAEMGDVI